MIFSQTFRQNTSRNHDHAGNCYDFIANRPKSFLFGIIGEYLAKYVKQEENGVEF